MNGLQPLNTTLSMTNIYVNITGQGNGFNGTLGGSAFFHSWNNAGKATIANSTFDESGFQSSFNLLNFRGANNTIGSYTFSNNIFTRTTNKTVRQSGNRIENVTALLTNNTFANGSFLDLNGNTAGITLSNNWFDTIANGFGIQAKSTTGTPTFNSVNTFNGPGHALKNISTTAITYSGLFQFSNLGNGFTGPISTTRMIAGGTANDILGGPGGASWMSGDDGDDTITGSAFADIMYGGTGNDRISSLAGDDWINAGDGADIITPGANNDVVTGGDGADQFNWMLSSGPGTGNSWTGDGTDIITDFSRAQGDKIGLSRSYPLTSSTTTVLRNTPANNILNGSDFAKVKDLASLNSTHSNKVIVLQTSTSPTAVSGTTVTGLKNACLLFHDAGSGKAKLYWDNDWSNSGTSSSMVADNRMFCMTLSNITSLAEVQTFTNNQFHAI